MLRDLLVESGHDVIHVRDLQMAGSTDEEVIAQAATQSRVLISADTDFGALLARTHATEPSCILIRRASNRRADEQSRLLTSNLEVVADDARSFVKSARCIGTGHYRTETAGTDENGDFYW